jgi:hypothetical protein
MPDQSQGLGPAMRFLCITSCPDDNELDGYEGGWLGASPNQIMHADKLPIRVHFGLACSFWSHAHTHSHRRHEWSLRVTGEDRISGGMNVPWTIGHLGIVQRFNTFWPPGHTEWNRQVGSVPFPCVDTATCPGSDLNSLTDESPTSGLKRHPEALASLSRRAVSAEPALRNASQAWPFRLPH